MEETRAIKRLTKRMQTDKNDQKQKEIGGNLNPLEIPLVVKIIVSYINKVEDMKSLRTLHTSWRNETFKKLRNSAILLITKETLPLLLQAYSEQNWEELSKEEKERLDPFQLRQVPFKGYRFSSEQSWAYPLEDNELDKKLIWETVITPNATYLDVGESAMKWYRGRDKKYRNYSYGVYWIVSNCRNVTELAMAPIKSNKEIMDEPGDVVFMISDGLNLQNKWPESKKYYFGLGGQEATQLKSLTISAPSGCKEDDGQEKIYSLFSDKDHDLCYHNASWLTWKLFNMTPNLKNLQLKMTNKEHAFVVLNGLRHPAYGYPQPKLRLQSLDVLGLKGSWLPSLLSLYLGKFKSNEQTLQELKMSFTFSNEMDFVFHMPLLHVSDKLTRLEVEFECEMRLKPPMKTNLHLSTFANLAHFKLNLDYKTFPGRLLTINLNELKGMPLLQEFHFGTKGNLVDKAWITRKLSFDEEALKKSDRRVLVKKLLKIKSFHFHGNFTKEALQKLGRMTENLKTLEVVTDEENFSAVKEIWPGLRNLNLLPCSNVPEEDVKALEDSNPSWNVSNESENYSQCASMKISDDVSK